MVFHISHSSPAIGIMCVVMEELRTFAILFLLSTSLLALRAAPSGDMEDTLEPVLYDDGIISGLNGVEEESKMKPESPIMVEPTNTRVADKVSSLETADADEISPTVTIDGNQLNSLSKDDKDKLMVEPGHLHNTPELSEDKTTKLDKTTDEGEPSVIDDEPIKMLAQMLNNSDFMDFLCIEHYEDLFEQLQTPENIDEDTFTELLDAYTLWLDDEDYNEFDDELKLWSGIGNQEERDDDDNEFEDEGNMEVLLDDGDDDDGYDADFVGMYYSHLVLITIATGINYYLQYRGNRR